MRKTYLGINVKFLVIIDVTLQNQKQELQHRLRPLKSSSLVLILTTQAQAEVCMNL